MKFSKFAKYLQKLEETSGRIDITNILTDLITELDADEVDVAIYLSLGYLQAPFESEKFNIAEKMMVRVLETVFEDSSEKIKATFSKSGDLGSTILKLSPKNTRSNTSVTQIHTKLLQIAKIEGIGSQDAKNQKLAQLLKDTDGISAKYITRIVLGNTRLGFTELTVIDALSQYVQQDKKLRKQIEGVYNTHPDIGMIAKKIKHKGIKGIEDIKIETGTPILPQACQRLPSTAEIIKKMGTVWGEYKFDGTRVQLHFDRLKKQQGLNTGSAQNELFADSHNKNAVGNFAKTFTRNLEETTHQFPDIIEAANIQIDAKSVILDGEAIGYDKKTGEFLPFQQIMQRKRKHNIAEMVKQIPIKYYVFDILYLDGKSLIDKPLKERRKTLKMIIKKGDVIEPDLHVEAKTEEELTKFFEKARDKGLEGVIVKDPNAPYMAGARSYAWVKLKVADVHLLDDTVDAVVLGYYFGRGARAAFGIGGFLAGVYDKKTATFKSITKVGTGLKEADWLHLKKEADKLKVTQKPKDVDIHKTYTPDVWVQPQLVVELGADEVTKSATHSTQYALRFPRLIKFRSDKDAHDSTSIKEIQDLHKMQKRGYY